MDAFNVSLTRDEIDTIQNALGEKLASLLKEWEREERLGEGVKAAAAFEKADTVRALMNKVGAVPLNIRSLA